MVPGDVDAGHGPPAPWATPSRRLVGLVCALLVTVAGCESEYRETVTLYLFGGGAIEIHARMPEKAFQARRETLPLTRSAVEAQLGAGMRLTHYESYVENDVRVVSLRVEFDDVDALARSARPQARQVHVRRESNGDITITRTLPAAKTAALAPSSYMLVAPTRIVRTNGERRGPRTVVWSPSPGDRFTRGAELRVTIMGPRYFVPHIISALVALGLVSAFWYRRKRKRRGERDCVGE